MCAVYDFVKVPSAVVAYDRQQAAADGLCEGAERGRDAGCSLRCDRALCVLPKVCFSGFIDENDSEQPHHIGAFESRTRMLGYPSAGDARRPLR